MRSARTTLLGSVALLISAHSLGCTDGPTDPAARSSIARQTAKGASSAIVALERAMSGALGSLKVSGDNASSLTLSGPTTSVPITFAFTGAQATYANGGCTVSPATTSKAVQDALAAQLSATVNGKLWLEFDKTADGSPSAGHHLEVTYTDATLGVIHLSIPAHGNPPPTASLIQTAGTTRVYQYSGGVVRVWNAQGPTKTHVKLFCDNSTGPDAVRVTASF